MTRKRAALSPPKAAKEPTNTFDDNLDRISPPKAGEGNGKTKEYYMDSEDQNTDV
ncbi:MAG: hypothetical protein QM401_11055 [Bacillota bacterium]|nr:hypothetical protein [Bacillota bacterium]